MNPLITIGIPVYNVEKYIKESLLSALEQTYPNIEIIIIDDKGNDKSMDIVRQTIQTHPRKDHVKIIPHKKNEGLSCARNTIIENAQGEFLYFMDSDDSITNDCIQLLYDMMKSNPADFVEASYDVINENNSEILSTFQHSEYHIHDKNCIYNHIYQHYLTEKQKIAGTAWNKMFHINFLRENNINFIPGIYYEDRLFVSLIYLKGHSCHILPNITYHYRERKGSIMHKGIEQYKLKEIKDYTFYLDWRKNLAKEYKQEEYYELFIYETMIDSFFSAYHYLKKKQHIDVPSIDPYIKALVKYPFPLSDIRFFYKFKKKHIMYWLFDKCPYWMQLSLLKHIK